MAEIYPAGTTTIRNLTPRYKYFLVVKPDALVDDIPQKEYFVYRYKVTVSAAAGIKSLSDYFTGVNLIECKELSDVEYATGNFQHPDYTNSNLSPLTFKLRDIPIYLQSQIGIIDLNKDPYQYGSKPVIDDSTSVILDNN